MLFIAYCLRLDVSYILTQCMAFCRQSCDLCGVVTSPLRKTHAEAALGGSGNGNITDLVALCL